MRDEAEIRGHRRTYVGALPGRIIQGMRRAGSNNPVFMLDEIDKVGSDFRGDPSSALLEVLDPEQNFSFSDHYLDVPFDLSKVMFITTANVLDTIPPALRDRMEVLQLLGYTEDEKIKIANRYLIPRQREAHGLKAEQITITAGAIRQHHLRVHPRGRPAKPGAGDRHHLPGGGRRDRGRQDQESRPSRSPTWPTTWARSQLQAEAKARTSTPGVAMGLAWTPVGGDILFIEATAMKGKKGLTLTGQLGDVMKESATAALSFIRANAKKLGIGRRFLRNARPPHPRARRRHSQGRPVGRGHHADGPGLPADRTRPSTRTWP